MSGTQFYSIDQIISKGGEIETIKNELIKTINEMESIINEMKSVWQDAAQTKFAQQFASIQPDLVAFTQDLGKLSERAIAHANAVRKQADVL